jgi:hypothetical protein
MKKHISIISTDEDDNSIAFWNKKTPDERLSAVELLREQYYFIHGFDGLPRLKKIIKIVEPKAR